MCGSRACDPRPGEVRTGGPGDPGHLPRHREFEGSASYMTGKPRGGRGRGRDCYVDREIQREIEMDR